MGTNPQIKALVSAAFPRIDFEEITKNRATKDIIVLDDSLRHDGNGIEYISDFSGENTDEIGVETIFDRYTEGLQKLEGQGHINLTALAYWKTSSYKDGNHIKEALDDNPQTFWQSDGSQPHYIDICFSKRVEVIQLAFFFSLLIDESYTPQVIKVYAGHSLSDATLYKTLEIRNVNGWVALTFEDNRPNDKLLKCQFLRLTIPVNHENGKDTHLRGVRLYSPSSKTYMDDSRIMECFSTNSIIFGCSIR